MSRTKNLLVAILIAGMFLVPPAACAAPAEQTMIAAVSETPQVLSYSPVKPVSTIIKTGIGSPDMGIGQMEEQTVMVPVKQYVDAPMEMRGPRAGPDVEMITLAWVSPADVVQWGGAGVMAKKGAATQFNVTINNSGDTATSNVPVNFTIYDAFAKIIKSDSTTITSLAPGQNQTLYFYWTPTFCTYFQLNIYTNCTGDANFTNNNVTYNRFMNGALFGVALWADMSTTNSGWTGDLANDKWHISGSPEQDNVSQHSGPESWYHGTDRLTTDSYDNNMDASVKSPTFDLRQFTSGYMLHLGFRFHGALPIADAGDKLEHQISRDNGATWRPAFGEVTGPALAGSMNQLRQGWFNWYVDLNQDNAMQGNEIGLDISDAAGYQAMFRNHFTSNAAVTETGIYLDDYCIWGIEIFDNCAVEITSDLAETIVNDTETVTSKVTNVGATNQPNTFNITFNVSTSAMPPVLVYMENKTVNALTAGASQDISFSYKFDTKDNYVVRVNISGMVDGDAVNNIDTRRVHVCDAAPLILLVDDNPFGGAMYTTETIMGMLSDNGYNFAVYHTPRYTGGDGAGSTLMSKYQAVIWTTGWDNKENTDNGTLTANDISAIKSYLNAGGSFWLMSMELMNDLGTTASFVKNNLHVQSAQTDADLKGGKNVNRGLMPNPMWGVAENEVGAGFRASTGMPSGTSATVDWTDAMVPDSSAIGVFYQNNSIPQAPGGPFTAISYAGTYRSVFQAFDPVQMTTQANRTTYAKRVIEFLTGGLSMHVESQSSGSPGSLSIDPGQSAVYTLIIGNSGSKDRKIANMEVSAPPTGWTAVCDPFVVNDDPDATIPAQGTLDVTLTVTAPANAPAETIVPVWVNITIKDYFTGLSNQTLTTVNAILMTSLAADTTEKTINGSGAVSYPFSIKNQGNMQVTAQLTKTGDHAEWISLSQNSVVLNAFEQKNLTAILTVPEGAYNIAGNYSLRNTLKAQSSYQDRMHNATLNTTTTVRNPQKYTVKIDDVELTPSDGLVDMAVAKPSAKIAVRVKSPEANGYDNATIELRPKSFTPAGASQRSWDGKDWTLPRSTVELLPYMTTTKESSLTVYIPSKADSGEYVIEVQVMPGSKLLADGGYQTITLKVLRPDIVVVDSVTFTPKEPEVGSQVKIKVTVKNIGGTKVRDVDVTFYGPGDNALDTKRITELAATTGTQTVEISWDGFVEGENAIRIKADPNGIITELNEDNNEVTATLVGLRSDIVIDQPPVFKVGGTQKTSVVEGTPVTVEVTVRNVGNFGVNLSGVAVRFTDQTTGETQTQTITSLNAKGEQVVSFTWVARKTGAHTLAVKVNPESAIKEKSADNNEMTGTLKVTAKAPDTPAGPPMMMIGAVIGIVAVVGVLGAVMMMRRKTPPAKTAAVEEAQASEAPAGDAGQAEEPPAEDNTKKAGK